MNRHAISIAVPGAGAVVLPGGGPVGPADSKDLPSQGGAWTRMQFAKKLFPQHVIKGPP